MSLFDRVRDLLRSAKEPDLTPDTPGLVVVAEAFDITEADSAVLARSHRWHEGKVAVLRHHLTLPSSRVGEAGRMLAQDGWELRTVSEALSCLDSSPLRSSDRDRPCDARESSPSGGVVRLQALRVQELDALHCAQERSRMAGLAQRLGGDSLGWDALQHLDAG